MGLPTFRRPGSPRFQAPPRDVFRGSSRSRGYTATWDRFSYNYRRRHPFCAECERRGRVVPADVTDHIVPLEDGGPKFDVENLNPLCHACHNTVKREIEEAAREAGDPFILLVWWKRPDTRPAPFAYEIVPM